ncbi:pseudouridine synthase [Clostridium sp. CMCC3677]|uniref:RNA pseudouridine synthase n=1 Tax=Clostridium sp. CMCC3677 TaxID=2949963 RepID=UPI0013F04B82|nr:pseudouridine synthase [Clostridium sp. CMCC3677]NFG62273.1 pseudouridine synthase [Clostridium botulinum]NFQ09690.1 pseudouridine synthase [Clostridium botulinum]
MRINKLFSNLGICSRKDTSKLIEENRIIVNGIPCIQGQWVELEDEILLDNKTLPIKKKIYIALNKPVGVTCTAADEVENNIMNFMDYPEYIFPVGRLDKASQGLILLTNDGDLANNILESENEHEKEYIVTLDRPFNNEFILGMTSGVEICNVKTRHCKVRRISEDTFNIVLTQGLNKQIRRMSKVFGYNVKKLERIRILNIELGNLEYGKWRYLLEEEIEGLKNSK